MNKFVQSLFIAFALSCLLSAKAQTKGAGTFEVGKNTFLVNGKPILIKAAELHYTRIPKPYWEHRIKMCKAMGMNTICIYIFWNIHEQKEGKFDFTGQNNIAEFCRIAQKQGMYVIVRPGPYVCAEWEMGGLPWWLLKKDKIALRTLDPYFMERTGIFLKEVGKQLAPLQITRGGNIVMVQVENEFGAYGTDKPYVSAIRDQVKAAGFTDVPLFQCDWSSTFERNGLDDLLWTINFGTGANIEQQFKNLKSARPDSPLMCSEYWSGWFDHWGRKHETRPAENMVRGIKEMVDSNISFSLYMAHGGTTFGHWGGANSPTYSAMCSSYDYDAPISEAGWATEKFHLLRDALAGYLPEGEQLPVIPEAQPVIEIPTINFEEATPLFKNLPAVQYAADIHPMEYFDQGWGSILYRTAVSKEIPAGSILKITEVHDWAQVFVNGERLAFLDRRQNEHTVVLPQIKSGAQLDILVEAMGRVNFGYAIHDRKGITQNVEIINRGDHTDLKNWEIYSFPVEYSFVKKKNFAKSGALSDPAYYRASFSLNKTGDTFLDMSTWGKGMVWINGYAIGRFWEIGPQQTLFVPGCWLKKGKNEIIILDLKGPAKASVSGLSRPILDVLRVKTPQTHRKEGENLSLREEPVVTSGSFTAGNGWQEIVFSQPVSGRYFCLEALSAQDGKEITAIAELDILGDDGKPILRENWRIGYADSEEVNRGNRAADKIFDLQESTFWSTVEKAPYPHHLVIDLGKLQTVKGFRYLPRAEKGYPGMIKDYRIYVKRSPFVY